MPNALDDITAVTDSVVSAVQRMKTDDYVRYEMMLKEVIEPRDLWRELALNAGAFTSETVFDGGFKVAALFGKDRIEADFGVNDVGTFARTIRDIRNHLSHGRDQKTGTTIAPTTHNMMRLSPWVGPVRAAASQVIIYKDIF